MESLFKSYMPKDLSELQDILCSGALAYGKWGKMLEKSLQEYIGVDYLITTNSYNSAFLVLLTTLGLKMGDEVIASPMACLASNQPFAVMGIKVIWADIDPRTGTLDPESVKSKITSRTRAIFHNHFCGYVGYVDEIGAVARENGLYIIDDAIEAFGSKYKGCKIGAWGADATIYSFQTVRLPNTIDGGAIVFKDEELYIKSVLVRDYGIDRSRFRDDMNEISSDCDITVPGYGATLNEISSYIGSQQLNQIDSLLAQQKENAIGWKKKLENENVTDVVITGNTEPNYWVYGVLADNKRDFINSWRKKGFYASGVHLPNSYYSIFGNQGELYGVNEFSSRFVALPSGWWFKI